MQIRKRSIEVFLQAGILLCLLQTAGSAARRHCSRASLFFLCFSGPGCCGTRLQGWGGMCWEDLSLCNACPNTVSAVSWETCWLAKWHRKCYLCKAVPVQFGPKFGRLCKSCYNDQQGEDKDVSCFSVVTEVMWSVRCVHMPRAFASDR